MQYAPTLLEGRSEPSTAFPSPKRMGLKNASPNLQPTRIGKSDPWAFPSLAGRTRGRMQYAPTHSTGRKIAPSAFLSPKKMGFKNVPPNPQPTRIGKSAPLAFPSLVGRARGRIQYAPTLSEGRGISPSTFPSLAGRARGRMQYAPTLPEGRKITPWAFPSLAGRARGRMQYVPTLLEGRKNHPWAFPSPKRMGFKNVPANP